MPTNHALFAAAPVADAEITQSVRLTRFTIDQCRAIAGPAPNLQSGSPLLRLETSTLITLPIDPALQFRGTAQHLNYSAAHQRADLESRSRSPFPDGTPGVIGVMIPIHKTDAWWQLAPEIRTAHFQKAGEHHQHAAIGSPYVERIYRKLYHSRYTGGPESPIPYDFVTYFEFLEPDRAAFEELLAGLRDTKLNPEWAYVDGEFEVWMRRT